MRNEIEFACGDSNLPSRRTVVLASGLRCMNRPRPESRCAMPQKGMGADLLRFSASKLASNCARSAPTSPIQHGGVPVGLPLAQALAADLWPSPSAGASGRSGSRPVRDGSPGHRTRPFRRWLGRRHGRLRAHTAVLRLARCPGRLGRGFRHPCIDPASRSGRSGFPVLPTRRCRLSCSPVQPSLLEFRFFPSDPSSPLALPFRTVWKLPSFR